jgi:peptidyl-prolyl cis-trans isomerase D
MKGVSVTDEELRNYYSENASRFSVAEERRASHILIQSGSDKKAARAKADALLAQLRKSPASFAELARKNSQDEASAPKGGDLDFSQRGGLAAKSVEDAVFAMKTGEISDVIESEFGYHIVTLTAVRGGDKRPFEEARGEIESEVRKALAQKKYAEAAEQFTNTVYEQSDSLQPVIDKLKLTKQTATVQRKPAPGAPGALASIKLLEALFSSNSISKKRNTDAVEIGPNQLASARIVNYTPARTLPLSEVKDKVRERVVGVQAAALARKEGLQRLAEVQKDVATALPTKVLVSRSQTQGLPRSLIDAVLRADAGKLPAVTGVDLGDAGYTVLRITQVLPREVPAGGDAPLQQQYIQSWAQAESDAYLDSLKRRLKVEVKDAAVAAAAASAPGP